MSNESLSSKQRRYIKKAKYTAKTTGCPVCRKRFGLGEVEVRTLIEGRIAFVHAACLPLDAPINGYAQQFEDKDPYLPGDCVWFLNHGEGYRVRPPIDRNELVMFHKMQLLADLKAFGKVERSSELAAELIDDYDLDPDSVRVVVVQVAEGQHGRLMVPTELAAHADDLVASAGDVRGDNTLESAHTLFMEAQQLDIDMLQGLSSTDGTGASLLERAAAIGRSRNATKR
jgi:hypothetical protein